MKGQILAEKRDHMILKRSAPYSRAYLHILRSPLQFHTHREHRAACRHRLEGRPDPPHRLQLRDTDADF